MMNVGVAVSFDACDNINCTILIAALRGKSPSGGDVWVLAIKATRPSDTDLYVCEVNSDPPFKSFHPLKGNSGCAATSVSPKKKN